MIDERSPDGLRPVEPRHATERPVDRILAEWRAAEREHDRLERDDPRRVELEATMGRYRHEYAAQVDAAS